MPHRNITDQFGTEWDVWEVIPSVVDRRVRALPRTPERRQADLGLANRVSERLKHGWLAFQSRHEKRRLIPVPARWADMDADALVGLLERARRVGKPSRLIE